jgi:hypothetical protein
MKKVICISVFTSLLSVTILHAQITKKDFLLGGSLGFGTNSSTNSPTNSNANISPRIGYAIGNNSVLYSNFSYSFYNSKGNSGGSEYTNNSFSMGISWKRFIPIKEKFGVYTNLYGSFGVGNYNQDNATPPTSQRSRFTSYSGGFTPGVYYTPATWLIVNVDAGGIIYNYSRNKYNTNASSHSSNFNVSFLNTFSFGIDFILNKKKA